MKFNLLAVIQIMAVVHAAEETLYSAIEEALGEEVDKKDVPIRETGMLYSVPETIY